MNSETYQIRSGQDNNRTGQGRAGQGRAGQGRAGQSNNREQDWTASPVYYRTVLRITASESIAHNHFLYRIPHCIKPYMPFEGYVLNKTVHAVGK